MDNMENNDNRNHREYGPFDYLLSFIFIIWFVGSVIGIIYCFNHEKDAIGVTLVGGIFLVFGLIIVGQGIYYQNFAPITLIFPLIGTGLIIFGLIYYFDNERLKYIAEKSLPNLLLMFFTAVGTGMIIGGIKLYQNQVDNCSYVTMATCVKVRNKTYHGTPVQCPVFQIELEGKTMVICNRCY
ncbi:MAG: hypothetical protein J5546_06490, partial [Lachnospiraceae bacterium]|nr:hypothetical protein [Lachnospiraceae bacterium]